MSTNKLVRVRKQVFHNFHHRDFDAAGIGNHSLLVHDSGQFARATSHLVHRNAQEDNLGSATSFSESRRCPGYRATPPGLRQDLRIAINAPDPDPQAAQREAQGTPDEP